MSEKLPELPIYRIGELEEDVRGLKDDLGDLVQVVQKIKNNHLVHLKSQISKVNSDLKIKIISVDNKVGLLDEKVDNKMGRLATKVDMGIAVNILQVVALIVGLVLIFKK